MTEATRMDEANRPALGSNAAAVFGSNPAGPDGHGVYEIAKRMDADNAAREAAERARLPTVVIVDDPAPAPASPAPAPSPSPAAPAPAADNLKPPMALGDRQPAPVADWIADIRKTGEGNAALEQWPDHAGSIPFAAPVLANVVNAMPADHADLALGLMRELQELRPAAYVSLLKAFAGIGRQTAAVAGDPGTIGRAITPTKGSHMSETITGTREQLEAERQELLEKMLNAHDKGDRIKAQRFLDRVSAISSVLYPNPPQP